MRTTVPSVAGELARRTLPISAEVPSNPRVAMEIILELPSRQRERGQLVSEDYARGIQTFKSLFARYGHRELADSLPELPQGSVTSPTGEVNATASGLPDRAETQTEGHQEYLSTDMPPEEPMTDDNFTLSKTNPTRYIPDGGCRHPVGTQQHPNYRRPQSVSHYGGAPSHKFRASGYYFHAGSAHGSARRMKANKSPLKLPTIIL